MTKTIDVREIQGHFDDLLSLVRAGDEVILTEGTEPIARLAPFHPPAASRVPGLHAGAMSASEEFDQPLPEDFWTGAS